MIIEELLQPRFKVIYSYPCSIHKLGDIISTYESAMSYSVQIDGISEKICLEDYPHLFRKLKWFEDRKIEDLPEYLKQEKDGKIYDIYKVVEYIKMLNHSQLTFYYKWKGTILYDLITLPDLLPATKEEYEANNNI